MKTKDMSFLLVLMFTATHINLNFFFFISKLKKLRLWNQIIRSVFFFVFFCLIHSNFREWHINFRELFVDRSILVREQQLYYLTSGWMDEGIHTLLKSISRKVNLIMRMESELIYFENTVQHHTYYASSTPAHIRYTA